MVAGLVQTGGVGSALTDSVEAFVAALSPPLAELARRVPAIRADRLEDDVVLEAYDLSTAFIDSDGLHTDNELEALLETFGPLLEGRVIQRATPGDVRKAGIVQGRRAWLEKPSALFQVLLSADRRDGTALGWTYYERAMAVAHAVCAVDAHTSHLELTALEAFRSRLISTLQAAGIRRPDGPTAPAAATGSAPAVPTAATEAPARAMDDLLDELDSLIGLAAVKAEVKLVANLIQVQNLRRQRNLPVPETSRHLVFTGNPGTGKTTVARLLGQIYRTLGVVGDGHLVETDRSGLVAGFVGQTAARVGEVVRSAIGGVLLIDEAHGLARGGERDFGIEAIDTLVKLMEDHRHELAVIVAGYPAEMDVFLDSNPGLRSRFPRTIHFPDYTTDELVAIFEMLCERNDYRCDGDARAAVGAFFDRQPRGEGFGNGRLARNLFEDAIARQASRIVGIADPSDEQLVILTAADIP